MRKFLIAFGMEVYALALAVLQFRNGVRTDEAKYLLNIPYPHPPLARFILSSIDGWQYQEIFWRIVFASLLVQAVWLFVALARSQKIPLQIAIAVSWLFSSAVIYQSGTVMMAVLTALEAALFIYLFLSKERDVNAGVIAMLWLLSLFTAYQIVLFAPLVWALLRRAKIAAWLQFFIFVAPIILLILYTFSNPLAFDSMFLQAGKNASDTLFIRFTDSLRVWALGGSVFLGIAGTYGILRSRSFPLIGSFVLVCAFIVLARYDYYAILFTPLFLAGLIVILQRSYLLPFAVSLSTLVVSTALLFMMPPLLSPGPARAVMQNITQAHANGPVLLNGNFGHEWEYESPFEILRYQSHLLSRAGAAVCLSECPDELTGSGWTQIASHPAVFIHR